MTEKIQKLTVSTVLCFLGFFQLSAQAGVIFDNGGPDPNLGWPISDFDGNQQIADDFVLAAGENVIRDIHWWGNYGSGMTPDTDDFTIRIFEQDADRPSVDMFQTVTFLSAPGRMEIMDPGATLFQLYYEYWVDIEPITLDAGVTHWLSIVNNITGTGSPNWLWAKSANLGNRSANRANDGDDWRLDLREGADVAFNLTNDVPVPEPTTLALMGLGLAGIGYQRRRKQR